MKPGPMRQRVTLQSPAQSSDGYGDPVTTWTTVGTYWARVVFTGGTEAVNAQQDRALETHRITMRYVSPIDPSMRLLYVNRILNILTVNNVDERNREYEITAREVLQPVTAP